MTKSKQGIIKKKIDNEVKHDDFNFSMDMISFPKSNRFIQKYKKSAWNASRSLAIPTVKDNRWRLTSLKDFRPQKFNYVINNNKNITTNLEINEKINFKSLDGCIVLYTDEKGNNYDEDIIKTGIIFEDLRSAEINHPQILEKVMGKIVKINENKFTALAGALAQNGVLLYVPQGVKIDRPFYSLNWTPGSNIANFSHILVYLEKDASASIILEYSSPEYAKDSSMHSGIVEIQVGERANLQISELLSWGENIWDISNKRCIVENDGNVDWTFGAFGGRLIKNIQNIILSGKGSSGKMKGFYLSEKNQHFDIDTQQNHNASQTTSDLLYKGVLLGKSRVVWQGMINVTSEAHTTDGFQANRNLILSPEAHVQSIPGLEILVDDVKCSHSATIGDIDSDQIYYLESRGISKKEAEMLIITGFFEPIIQGIPQENIRKRYQDQITKILENNIIE